MICSTWYTQEKLATADNLKLAAVIIYKLSVNTKNALSLVRLATTYEWDDLQQFLASIANNTELAKTWSQSIDMVKAIKNNLLAFKQQVQMSGGLTQISEASKVERPAKA